MKAPDDNDRWRRMRFKRNKVWMALNADQTPMLDNGKVLIKYQLDQAHQYWVHPSSVLPLDEPPKEHLPPPSEKAHDNAATTSRPPQTLSGHDRSIRIYTHSVASGSPGPAGIGVVLIYGDRRKEISQHIGTATNNMADLEAIRAGLAAVKNRGMPVNVFTDSRFALGVLTQGWKSYIHEKRVAEIRGLLDRFKNARIFETGDRDSRPESDRAAHLAVNAIQNSKTP